MSLGRFRLGLFALLVAVFLLGAEGCKNQGSSPAPPQVGDIVIPPELYQAFDALYPDIAPVNWLAVQRNAAKGSLGTRRAMIYVMAQYLYANRNRFGFKIHGLKAIDYDFTGDGHEADARAIALQIGFTYDGSDTSTGPDVSALAHRLLEDKDYTLGELATLADNLLLQYHDSFELILPWADSGYGHDEGFGSSF